MFYFAVYLNISSRMLSWSWCWYLCFFFYLVEPSPCTLSCSTSSVFSRLFVIVCPALILSTCLLTLFSCFLSVRVVLSVGYTVYPSFPVSVCSKCTCQCVAWFCSVCLDPCPMFPPCGLAACVSRCYPSFSLVLWLCYLWVSFHHQYISNMYWSQACLSQKTKRYKSLI